MNILTQTHNSGLNSFFVHVSWCIFGFSRCNLFFVVHNSEFMFISSFPTFIQIQNNSKSIRAYMFVYEVFKYVCLMINYIFHCIKVYLSSKHRVKMTCARFNTMCFKPNLIWGLFIY